MKRVKLILLATIVLASCSSTQSVPTTTTPPTTNPTPPTTVAPIDYGSDCTDEKLTESARLLARTKNAQDDFDDNSNKSRSEMLDASNAYMESYRNLRSFVRNLDIPLLIAEQRNLVDAIQDYVDAFNRFLESDGRDLSVNDYIIPLEDAIVDFNKAFRKAIYGVCL